MGFEEIIFYKKMTHISGTNMMIGFSLLNLTPSTINTTL